MKDVIIPLVVMMSLLAHIGYRVVATESFVFSNAPAVQEIMAHATDSITSSPVLAGNSKLSLQYAPTYYTANSADPSNLPVFNYVGF